jgi:5S rRNA maturation endonuclease (ribonuclease M5)
VGKAFDRIIEAAHNRGLKVKMLGQNQASMQAPGHSAHDQSVSVTNITGGVLVFSHSDPTENVLDDLGITKADLFDEPKGATYTYGDGRQVHRSPDKKFRQSGNTKGTELFHADRLAAAQIVFMVEGEKDVLALEALGVTATCTAMGAGKAHMFDLTPLYGKHVQIVRDMDEAGVKHAQQVAGLLAGKAASVAVLEPAVGKDAADHVAAGHSIDDFRPADLPTPAPDPEPVDEVDPEFERAVSDAIWHEAVKIEARQRSASTGAATLNPKLLRDIQAMDFPHDWLVDGLLERQDRLILTGGEGAGKSYFTRQIAICVAAGVHPFQRQYVEPRKVLVIDAENSERQWARNTRYVTGITAAHRRGDPGSNVLVSAGVRLDLTLKADVDTVHRLMDQFNPDMLYIGPLYKLVPREINTNDDAAPLIAALDMFRERGVTLLMEAHAGHGKQLGGDRDLRPRGSSALMGWPEFGLGLRPVEEDDTMVSLVHWRGDREVRDWPKMLRRGVEGELPWMAA